MSMSMQDFLESIKQMNEMYRLPAPSYPTLEAVADDEVHRSGVILPEEAVPARIGGFARTMLDELAEGEDIVELCQVGASPFSVLTAKADWLADLVVYCFSEAQKYGIPLDEVLAVVMDSNKSKLGADGKPIYNADGKFLKGPNYWAPEAKIKELLMNRAIEHHENNPEKDES